MDDDPVELESELDGTRDGSLASAPQQDALECVSGPKVPGRARCPIGRAPLCVRTIDARMNSLERENAVESATTGTLPTEDGGHYRYFYLNGGMVSLYCHPARTHGAALLVYGAIHEFWAQHGWETWPGVGYPIGEETDAKWPCDAAGGQRQQEFEPIPQHEVPRYSHILVHLCWSPERGVWLDHTLGNTSWEPAR